MAPATLGVAAVQINVVVNSSFASLVSDGAISWLVYAFRLMQLPIGVFGVAVGTTVAHPSVARRRRARLGRAARDAAARAAHGAVPDRAVDGRAGAAGRADHPPHLPARPFQPHATIETAHALSGYALGLVAYAAIKVVAPAFYALGRTRVPLIASVSAPSPRTCSGTSPRSVASGTSGLAVGTSIAALVNLAVLLVAFQMQIRGLFTRASRRRSRRMRWSPRSDGGRGLGDEHAPRAADIRHGTCSAARSRPSCRSASVSSSTSSSRALLQHRRSEAAGAPLKRFRLRCESAAV